MRILLIGSIAPNIGNKITSSCLPFGAMALSSYLKQRGVDCKLVSTALPKAVDEIMNCIDKVDLIGISSMSGPYLSYAISIVKNVRRIRPNLPIVWGGPHASLMDEDLIRSNLANYVIRGVGEKSLYNLIVFLGGKGSILEIAGLTWLENGQIKRNDPDPNFNINEFPLLDYSLGEEHFPNLLNEEFFYSSSRGCPFNCSYCVASILYGRRWNHKTEDKVVEELKLAYQKYKFKTVFFIDDNLFVDSKRLSNILSKLDNAGVHFQWNGFCRADIFSSLNEGLISEFKQKGLAWLSFGFESGSQRILEKLSKGITLDNIRKTVLLLKKYEISCDFSFMAGIPGETTEDFNKTLELIRWIKEVKPDSAVRVFRFIPYPKMPILAENEEIRKFLPVDSYGWSKITYQDTRFPWVPKKIDEVLMVLSAASLYSEKPKDLSLRSFVIRLLYQITQFRIKHNLYIFPIESAVVRNSYSLINPGYCMILI